MGLLIRGYAGSYPASLPSSWMMSLEEGIGGFNAERKFWEMPQLAEELIPHLDLESIKQLAMSHKLTQQILGKNLIWNQLIKSTFAKVNNIDLEEDFPPEDWPHDYADLASDKAKVRQLFWNSDPE